MHVKNFFLKKHRIILCSQGIVLTAMFLLFVSIGFFLSDEMSWLFFVLLSLFLAVTWLFTKLERNPWKRMLFFSLILSGSLNVLLNVYYIPRLFRYQGAVQALEVFENNRDPGDKLYNFELEEYELFFYSKFPVAHLKDWTYLYQVMEKPGTWVYTNSVKHKDIMKMGYDIDSVYQIKQQGMNALTLQFLNPVTRKNSLESNYLIKMNGGQH